MASSKTNFLALSLIIVLTITQAALEVQYNLLSSSATLPSKVDQYYDTDGEDDDDSSSASLPTPSRRLSRFLAEKGDNKNNEVVGRGSKNCEKVCKKEEGKKKQCCNNKCVDENTDNNNCGRCGNICNYSETCCKGKCVDLFTDKTNCGNCHNRCSHGRRGFATPACVRGMCNYA